MSETETKTIQGECNKRVDIANDKYARGISKIDKCIEVSTFFGGLILFGLTGKQGDSETTYTQDDRRIMQLQILNFCLFFGAIMSAFIFRFFAEFRKWTSYHPYDRLDQEFKTAYDANDEYDKPDKKEEHKKLMEAAECEDKRRDNFRALAKMIPFWWTFTAVILLLVVVFDSAAVQLRVSEPTDSVSELQSWVLPVCITFAVLPMVMAIVIVLCYTNRLYDITFPKHRSIYED